MGPKELVADWQTCLLITTLDLAAAIASTLQAVDIRCL